MSVLMGFRLMSRMVMVVRAVLPGVAMVVNFGLLAVAVFMNMLMKVFMGMGMLMLMAVLFPVVGVFVRVNV